VLVFGMTATSREQRKKRCNQKRKNKLPLLEKKHAQPPAKTSVRSQ
jgi:hypothetical protein